MTLAGCSECLPFRVGMRGPVVEASNPICPIREQTCVEFKVEGGGIQRKCPCCGELLGYRVMYPPIPLVIREWTFGEDDEDHSAKIDFCPVCDHELPIEPNALIDEQAHVSW